MTRLIDAEKLKKHYAWWEDDERRALFDQIVDAQPTAEPVRHGKWIKTEELQNCHDINGRETWGIKYMCESCGFKTIAIEGHFAQYKYCPQCGARMDKDV